MIYAFQSGVKIALLTGIPLATWCAVILLFIKALA